MRYVTAALCGLLVCMVTFFVVGLLLGLSATRLNDIHIQVGLIGGNLTAVISALLAAVAAAYTFRLLLAVEADDICGAKDEKSQPANVPNAADHR